MVHLRFAAIELPNALIPPVEPESKRPGLAGHPAD